MIQDDDQLYFMRRAAQERARAEAARDATIADLHRTIATAYERRVESSRADTPDRMSAASSG